MSIGRGRGKLFTPDLTVQPGTTRIDPTAMRSPSAVPVALEPLFQGPIDDLTVFWALYNSATRSPTEAIKNIEHVINFIFNKVILDTSNSEHIAKYIYLLSRHPILGSDLLKAFFSRMEDIFNDRDNIRSLHGMQGLRNFVKFFCDVTHFTRCWIKPPFSELISALRILFEPLLLSNQDEDLKLFTICMLRYSKYLKMVSYMGLPESQLESSDYLDLTIRLRRRLAGDLSSTVTFVNTSTAATSSAGPTKVGFTWLLLCFEALSLGGFDDIPEPVQRYYSTVLGNHIKVLSSKNESMRVPISEAHHFKLSDISDFVTLV